MTCENVPSVLLEPEEVVTLFSFLAGSERDLTPDLLRLARRLEKAVSRGTTIEEMGQLRGVGRRGNDSRE